ncbi:MULTISPECIES: DUF47 domain-containing protein [Collinsella]|uniref:DUF47 domain-containing protein n=1 Tax=Collinsella TaxID=102106 RepID=UPI000B37295F|nr:MULTISPECIES: DUF47 family protein [Collinsella]MBM6682419.1 DUF47 family protein [Collinsella intestinalis]OUN47009.1 hypothetical protein B5G20_06350 [Collinsella sp. An7]
MARKNDAFYYDSFREHAALSCKAAELLHEVMSSYNVEEFKAAVDKMHAIEQAADEKKHEINDALVTAFVTPIEREDIALLSENLDTVTDRIEGVLHRLYFDNITEIRDDALELSEMIVRACTEMAALLEELPQFKRSKTLREHVIAINSLEEEADHAYIRAMRRLHTTCTDPLTVFSWHEVYTFLEYCVDSCEHVADTVSSIVMKNS